MFKSVHSFAQLRSEKKQLLIQQVGFMNSRHCTKNDVLFLQLSWQLWKRHQPENISALRIFVGFTNCGLVGLGAMGAVYVYLKV